MTSNFPLSSAYSAFEFRKPHLGTILYSLCDIWPKFCFMYLRHCDFLGYRAGWMLRKTVVERKDAVSDSSFSIMSFLKSCTLTMLQLPVRCTYHVISNDLKTEEYRFGGRVAFISHLLLTIFCYLDPSSVYLDEIHDVRCIRRLSITASIFLSSETTLEQNC